MKSRVSADVLDAGRCLILAAVLAKLQRGVGSRRR